MPITRDQHTENERFQRTLLIKELRSAGDTKQAQALEDDSTYVVRDYPSRPIKGIALALEHTREQLAKDA